MRKRYAFWKQAAASADRFGTDVARYGCSAAQERLERDLCAVNRPTGARIAGTGPIPCGLYRPHLAREPCRLNGSSTRRGVLQAEASLAIETGACRNDPSRATTLPPNRTSFR